MPAYAGFRVSKEGVSLDSAIAHVLILAEQRVTILEQTIESEKDRTE